MDQNSGRSLGEWPALTGALVVVGQLAPAPGHTTFWGAASGQQGYQAVRKSFTRLVKFNAIAD